MSNFYKKILFSVFIFVLFGLTNANVVHASTSELSGWAWSSNIGWISNNSKDANAGGGPYAVTVSTTTGSNIGVLSGYAWSSTIGWIKFGGLSNFPAGGGSSADATIDFSTTGATAGQVSGWARACAGTADGQCGTMASRSDGWDGWISLSGPNYTSPDNSGVGGISAKGVTLNTSTGALTGYAWGSDVIGWISFQAAAGVGVSVAPPNKVSVSAPTCNLSAVTNPNPLPPSGGNVTLTWTSSNATSCMGDSTGDVFTTGGALSGNTTIPVTQSSSFQLSCKNASFPSGQVCANTQVTINAPSSGLKLFIGSTANSMTSLGQNSTGNNIFRVRQGGVFALKWFNNLTPDYSCNPIVTAPDGSDASGVWSSFSSSNGTQDSIPSTGYQIGNYNFNIECLKTGSIIDSNTVQLKVSKSTVTEF